MKKLAKAQMGKIVKSVGNVLLKKRPAKQVFGTAGAIAGGTAITGAIMTNKAKKEFAESEAKKKQEELKKKSSASKIIKKTGGATKSKKK